MFEAPRDRGNFKGEQRRRLVAVFGYERFSDGAVIENICAGVR